MAEQVVLDIKIPTSDVESAEQAIGRMRGQVEELRAANKNLDKSSEAYTKNALEIKRLNGEIRTNERVLIANTKAQKANEGTVEQLREQLKIVSVEWAKVTKAEGENTKRSKELSAQKKKLTEQLKAVEKSTGDTRRNVGNYSEGMREALAQTGLFNVESKTLAAVQKTYQLAIGTSTTATRVFAAALAATGIGLVVGLIYSLREALTKTEEGQARLNKIMGIFSGVINGVFIALEPLATLIADGIIWYFEQLGNVVQKTFGFLEKTLRFLGMDQWANDLANFIDGIGGAADATQKLADAEVELNKARRQQEITQLKFQERAEKLRQIRDDDSKSIEERIAANEKLGKVLDEQSQKELELAQKAIEVAELRIKAEGETKDNLDALAEAELKVAEINERITSQRSEQLTNINSLLKEQGKISEDNAKAEEDRRKKEEEDLKAKQEAIQKALDAAKLGAEKELNNLKQQLLDGTITREQYEERVTKIQQVGIEARKLILKDDKQAQVELEGELLDLKLANQEKETEGLKKNKEKQLQIEKRAQAARENLTAQAIGKIASLFGQETKEYKLLASARTLITTYSSAVKAYDSQLTIPTPDAPIRAAAAAALAVASGLAQVAQINSTNVPQFADGVIGLDGPGTETSDSIPANLSRGESVMTAKATKAFAPQLAAMEKAVGNTPNYQLGNKRFAEGIIAAGNNPGITSGRNAVNQSRALVQDLRNMRVFLSLTELEERQTEFRQAQNKAEISEVG